MILVIVMICIVLVVCVFALIIFRTFPKVQNHDELLPFFRSKMRNDRLFRMLYNSLSDLRGTAPTSYRPSTHILRSQDTDASTILLLLTSVIVDTGDIPTIRCTDVKTMYIEALSLFKNIDIQYIVMMKKYDGDILNIMDILLHHDNSHNTLLFYNKTLKLNTDVIILKNSDTNILRLKMLVSKFNKDDRIESMILTDEIITNYANETKHDFTKVASYCYLTNQNIAWTGISLYPDTLLTMHRDSHQRHHDDFVMIQDRERLSNATYEQKIPFIIFQTFETRVFPRNMYNDTIQKWKTLNPEYSYLFYSTKDEYRFIHDHFPLFVLKVFDRLMPGAFKADLWRYCVLYQIGGVYADSRTSPLVPLRNIIRPDDDLITPKDCNKYGLWQGFLCACPRHPIIEMCIRWICNEVINRMYNENGLEITGPMLIGKMFNIFLSRPPQTFIYEGIYSKYGYIQNILYIDFSKTRCISRQKGGKDIYYKSTIDEYIWDTLRGTEHYGASFQNKRIFRPFLFPAVILILPFNDISALHKIKNSIVWLFCERIVMNESPLSVSNDALYFSIDILFTKDISKENISRITSLDKQWLVCWQVHSVDDVLSDIEWVRSVVWFQNVFEVVPVRYNHSYLF